MADDKIIPAMRQPEKGTGMNQRLIVIDGKTYKSVDEMPPDIRRLYEETMRNMDKNQNGVPDVFESANPLADKNRDGIPDIFNNMASMPSSYGSVASSTKIIVNGQEYDGPDQLPPEIRAKYQQVMEKFSNNPQAYPNLNQLPPEQRAKVQQALNMLDANKNGIPDFAKAMMNMPNNVSASAFPPVEPVAPLRPKPTPVSSSTIEPESSGNWIWLIAGIVFVGGCLVLLATTWYYFLR